MFQPGEILQPMCGRLPTTASSDGPQPDTNRKQLAVAALNDLAHSWDLELPSERRDYRHASVAAVASAIAVPLAVLSTGGGSPDQL